MPHWLQLMAESLPSLLWAGLIFTIPLTLLSFVFGLALGLATAIARLFGPMPLSAAARFYVWVIRGTPLGIGRAFGVRPGTPADRVAILRDSLAKALADPKFLAEMKTAQIEINHISAEVVSKAFNTMINQPPEVLAAMGKYLKAGGD